MTAPTTTRGSFAAMYEASRTASLDSAPRQVALDQLEPNPGQPRTQFHEATLAELAASIKTHGILQPLLVRPHPSGAPNRFQIVAGERRWQACKRAGVGTVPVVIKSLDDARCREVALIENVQREDISPLEEAHALEQILRESAMSHRELGDRIGKTKAYVEQRVRMLRYPAEVQQALASAGPFSPGHAKAVVQVEARRQELIEAIEAQNLSVREAERRAHQLRDLEQAALATDRAAKLADQILRPQGLTEEAYRTALHPAPRAKKAPPGQVDLRELAVYAAIERARTSGSWSLDAAELRSLLKQDLAR
ncbi:MAG: chromosome partitioning protein ParB [Cyanobacteria bacterium RYN_339]|nr:chromosome partitioning protein ParB [Cyanobacteria bacterium RYN_339]